MDQKEIILKRTEKVIYRDGKEIVKAFDSHVAKAKAFHEAWNHANIEETGLYVPKIKSVSKRDGKWAIISEYIEGETLRNRIRQDSENREKYLEMFVQLQIEVHHKQIDDLENLYDKVSQKIMRTDLDATVRYDFYQKIQAMPKQNQLCHGDFLPSNIILSHDNHLYILDWSHASSGSREADVAKTYITIYLSNKENAKKYLSLYLKNSDIKLEDIQTWMPIMAASRLADNRDDNKEILLEVINGKNILFVEEEE